MRFRNQIGVSALAICLAGCLPEGRPLEQYLGEERIADASNLDAPPDATAPVLCTEEAGEAVMQTFTTTMPDRNIDILWVDDSCREMRFGTIGPESASFTTNTFVGHVWRGRFRGDQEFVFEIKLEADTPNPLEVP